MLEGERIVLRNIKKGDIDIIFDQTRQFPDIDKRFPMSLLSELIVTKHFDPGDTTEDTTGGTTGDTTEACLLITLKPAGDVIGSIAYFNGHGDFRGVELAYHIFRPANRGKGYMGEALRLLTTFLFDIKNIPGIQINLEKGNTGSRKVAEKCGFTFDGTMKKAPRGGDVPLDIEMFSLTREEWKRSIRNSL